MKLKSWIWMIGIELILCSVVATLYWVTSKYWLAGIWTFTTTCWLADLIITTKDIEEVI